jgi:hypothetical protein
MLVIVVHVAARAHRSLQVSSDTLRVLHGRRAALRGAPRPSCAAEAHDLLKSQSSHINDQDSTISRADKPQSFLHVSYFTEHRLKRSRSFPTQVSRFKHVSSLVVASLHLGSDLSTSCEQNPVVVNEAFGSSTHVERDVRISEH